MKTMFKIYLLSFLLLITFSMQSQVNKVKITSKGRTIQTKNLKNVFNPVIISKTNSKALENKTVASLKGKKIKKIKVPENYFNRKAIKRWSITPQKPFSNGAGISSYGNFSRYGFEFDRVINWPPGNGVRLFSGAISWNAKKDKQYLISIHTLNIYYEGIITVGIGDKIYDVIIDDDRIFRIIVKAKDSGRMYVRISPIFLDEGNHRDYKTRFTVPRIIIDEI